MAQKYQVLARKYRPKRFSEVVGQDPVVTTLKNGLRFDKIAHAYLFSGSRGVGKTTLARLIAKALNCEALDASYEPCNECPSCLEIGRGQSLDVIEIDGASNRGIDDIRKINETVGYSPSHGRFKIYIIDEVHMLTKEAFNALLKTLEEPPERAKFFFATTEPHKVPATIISRCQRFDLGRILPSQITSKLEEIAKDLGREVELEALHHIAAFSDGSLRDAESLFDQMLCFNEGTVTAEGVRQALGLVSETHLLKLDEAFSECRLSYAFELVEYLFQAGKDLPHFLEQLIEHYRLLALCKTLGENALPAPLAPCYGKAARLYTQPQVLYLLEYLMQAESLIQKSASQRVFLEMTLLHLIRSKNRIPVEVLVKRLSELEEMLQPKELSPLPPVESKKGESPPLPEGLKDREISRGTPEFESAKAGPEGAQRNQLSDPGGSQSLRPPEAAKIESPPPSSITTAPPPPQAHPEKKVVRELKKAPFNPYQVAPLGEQKPEPPSEKHPSHYETLIRFTAVELEGSVKKEN